MGRFVPDEVEKPRETMFANATRLSGRDQIIARDGDTVDWLGKCYAEQVNGVRDWPIFDRKRLGDYLVAIGVDVEQAKSEAADAGVPEHFDSMQYGVNTLRGASFLTKDVHDVARFLRTKRALARA
jgi:hypothetical protein